jgi:hypothetical protein
VDRGEKYWKRNYYGLFTMHELSAPGGGRCVAGLAHGENTNEVSPAWDGHPSSVIHEGHLYVFFLDISSGSAPGRTRGIKVALWSRLALKSPARLA